MTDPLFRVDDLHVRATGLGAHVAGEETLRGLDLEIASGEVHAIVGPSGSGTSILGSTLMGSTSMGSSEGEVTAGSIIFRGDDVTEWPVDERAKAGMFLAFRSPQEIAGVSMIQFLRQSLAARKGVDLSVLELRFATIDWIKRLGLDPTFVDRYLNEGFSGAERQLNEIMQMAILEPELAILDQSDSALGFDALRLLGTGIGELRSQRGSMGVILIAPDIAGDVPHAGRLLDEVAPDHVHILLDGRIVESGGMELAAHVERHGYGSLRSGAVV